MEIRTNCKNCGAILKYNKMQYGKKAKCEYCNTEYHIDVLGRIEEYKVKLEIMGMIKEFYISELIVENVIIDGFRDISGRISYCTNTPKIKLELIEY